MLPRWSTRGWTLVAVLVAVLASTLACRPQPPAELELPSRDAEPVARGEPSVFIEAPQQKPTGPGPELDWQAVGTDLNTMIPGDRVRVDYDAEHAVAGSNAPLVTLVVFLDYQCPHCLIFEGTLSSLLARYPDELRVVWRHFPLDFHPQAHLAARAAVAAHSQGAFALMHEWLLANSSQIDALGIEQAARGFGLDLRRFTSELDGAPALARVESDRKLGRQLGLQGVPSAYVNGRDVAFATDEISLAELIDEEIVIAQALMDAGSSRREVWARFMAAAGPAEAIVRHQTDTQGLTVRGNANAPVELLMVADFDCPFSARSVATVNELLKRYNPSSGSGGGHLAVYFRHFPLPMHTHARAAHSAAVAADQQGQFWAMFELLFADPKQRGPADFEAMAKQLQLDLARFRRDMATADATIDGDIEFSRDKLGVTGTPTFFINGRKLSGAQPIDHFELVILEELAIASP